MYNCFRLFEIIEKKNDIEINEDTHATYLLEVICFEPSGLKTSDSMFENDPEIVLNSQDLSLTATPLAQVEIIRISDCRG